MCLCMRERETEREREEFFASDKQDFCFVTFYFITFSSFFGMKLDEYFATFLRFYACKITIYKGSVTSVT